MQNLERESFVYVIGAEKGPQKIGYAEHPKNRMTAIAASNPDRRVQINYLHKTTRKRAPFHERVTHCLLANYLVGGEWFDVTPKHAEDAIKAATAFVETYNICQREISAAIKMTGRRFDEIARMAEISEYQLLTCRGNGLNDTRLPIDPIAAIKVIGVLKSLGIEFISADNGEGRVARRKLIGGVKHD